MIRPIEILNLGLIKYQEAYKIQLELNQKVKNKQKNPVLIICSHPPIVTLGKRVKALDEQISWKGEIVQIERGGQVTYHGPSQIIIYPIIPINEFKISIEKFLNILESSMIKTLSDLKIKAYGNHDRGNPRYTGVWINSKKIASIGIALKRWVSYHGLALNLYKDPIAFTGINPCGFSSEIMTSIEEVINKKINRTDIENLLSKYLTNSFSEI